jgi:peptide-methionine (S)-S-oxide reductase
MAPIASTLALGAGYVNKVFRFVQYKFEGLNDQPHEFFFILLTVFVHYLLSAFQNRNDNIDNDCSCYWGTEKYIVKDFQKKYPGCIADAKVGFMNPDPNGMKDPSYRQVCSGRTGHVEVLNIELTKAATADHEIFEEMIKFFFSFHDPTTLNRQGNDTGTQYGSVIFCSNESQKEIAESVKAELQLAIDQKKVKTYQKKTVETAIVDYTTFYAAHEEHQEYLMKNPLGYCNHRYRFRDWPKLGDFPKPEF